MFDSFICSLLFGAEIENAEKIQFFIQNLFRTNETSQFWMHNRIHWEFRSENIKVATIQEESSTTYIS